MGRLKKIDIPIGYEALTIEVLPQLVHKEISIAYENEGEIIYDSFAIGHTKTKYEIAQSEMMPNGLTRAENYDRDCTRVKLESIKNTRVIFTKDNVNTFLQTKKDGHFVNQDNGKQVYYKIVVSKP